MKIRDEISADFIHRFDLFDGLDVDEMEAIRELVEHRIYEPGEHVVDEGEESRDVFVLVEGEIEITKAVDGGETNHLATLRPEAVLGELGLVLGEPRSATAVAKDEARLLRLAGESLNERRRAGDLAAFKIEHNILHSIARRQADMNARLMEAMEESGDQRVERDEVTDLREQLDEWSF